MLSHQKFLKSTKNLRDAGGRLLTFTANAGKGDEFDLRYYFEQGTEVVTLTTRTVSGGVPSLVSYFANSDFPEREANRTLRIKFIGNPNLPLEGE